MKYFAMAGLMLAALVGTNSANAGFVDNLNSASLPVGASGRTLTNSSISGGEWTGAGVGVATLKYTLSSALDLSSSLAKITLTGITTDTDVNFQVRLNGGVYSAPQLVSSSTPGSLSFSLAGLLNPVL